MAKNLIKNLMARLKEAFRREGEEVSIEPVDLTTGEDALAGNMDPVGNLAMLQINIKPSGEPNWYTAIDGSTIFEWKNKFSRQEKGMHPPFQFGEKVLISGFVETDPDGLYKIHVDADGRFADNFFIATVPKPDPLQDYAGMPLEAIVDIVDEKKSKWQISNIQNYDARLVEVTSKPIINPDEDQIGNLERGKRVVVKGRFLGFGQSSQDNFLEGLGYPKGSQISGENSTGYEANLTIRLPNGKTVEKTVYNPPRGYHDNSTFGIAETQDGRKITVQMPTGRVAFSGGVLECLTLGASSRTDRKHPEKGDYVRIGAYVTEGKWLSVDWCDPCLLDEPSLERRERYEGLRNLIKIEIDHTRRRLSEEKYDLVRNLIGELRSEELTFSELETVREITDLLPEPEKPVQTPKGEYNREGRKDSYAEDIDQAYGTRLESMTKDEFIKFSKSAVTGEKKQTGKHADTSYFFFLAEIFGVDAKIREELISSCLETRLERIRGKPYNHKRDFDDRYNIEQGLRYLAGVGTESSANKVFDYLRSFVEEGDYHEKGWKDKEREELPHKWLFSVTEAISGNLKNMPREVVRREIPYLEHLVSYLGAVADEPITVDVLNKTIDYFHKLEAE